MLTFPIELLRKAALKRDEGYLEDVLSKASEIRADGSVLFTPDVWWELKHKYNPTPESEKIISNPSTHKAKEKRLDIALSAIKENRPCWFDGCEELRASYKKQLNALGKNCSNCSLADLERKFRVILRNKFDS